ncbi:MAG TPA: GDP-L-fucose synthase [Chitinophagaceae bacterium]|nr:GDP-L-fucose synthase [Chitinophagaceae bacterium]
MINKNEKIFIAGHRGMLGSALCRNLSALGYSNLITRTSSELDLTRQDAVFQFFNVEKPAYVLLAAAKVGGIAANISMPAQFLYENLNIQNNVIHASNFSGVKKIVFLGSSCIYPRDCPQPMKEEYMLTGKPEPTNEGYAIAKIAGLKMIEYYHRQYGLKGFSVIPCNLYGTNDSFDPAHSHVLSALVKKICDAKKKGDNQVVVWGTGNAKREFMHVDDCANAIIFLFENYEKNDFINVGTGEDISINTLAELIASKVGFKGDILFDINKPDGMPRKCMDVSRLHRLGFRHSISLEQGIDKTINEYNNLEIK